MMKKAVLTILVLVSGKVLSYGVSNQQAKKVHVNSGTGIYFQTEAPVKNPHNCTSDSWYRIGSNAEFSKEMFSILLTARSSGKKISFNIDGCLSGYPKVTWINTHD